MISVEKVPDVNRVGLSQISNLSIRLRAFFIPDDQEKIPLSHSFLLSIKALTTKDLCIIHPTPQYGAEHVIDVIFTFARVF